MQSTKVLSGDIVAGIVNLVRDADPQKFGQAMRSLQKEHWNVMWRCEKRLVH